jgi:hypothetical protein
MCDCQPDNLQQPAYLTIFRFGSFGLNQFADFYPPLNVCIGHSFVFSKFVKSCTIPQKWGEMSVKFADFNTASLTEVIHFLIVTAGQVLENNERLYTRVTNILFTFQRKKV